MDAATILRLAVVVLGGGLLLEFGAAFLARTVTNSRRGRALILTPASTYVVAASVGATLTVIHNAQQRVPAPDLALMLRMYGTYLLLWPLLFLVFVFELVFYTLGHGHL